ncbi:hypothetical protein DRP05_01585 [Archaeoglobales archaeon]|nr:MAG: hypothetical protein DRP05_01585 [Archaeoglobales archaeon]
MKKRNMLCIKRKESLDVGHLILYNPYKNILSNFMELATKKEAKDFDPVAKVYHGLLSAPPEIREYYEALLGVTSYYQASKGGRGRYIEKKLASSFEFCSLDVKLSQIPFWLTYPAIHRKKGIFTLQGLSASEKKSIRRFHWDWIGEKDEETDLGSVIKNEKVMVLMEIKNRVDSGGTAARREIWTSQKFGVILDHLIEDKKIYRKHEEGEVKDFTFAEMLLHFDIHHLEMYIGILFDITDSPASIDADKRNGFYSSSKEGFNYLLSKMRDSKKFDIIDVDDEKLQVEVRHRLSGITIKCGALYGDEVTEKLFRQRTPVSDLLLLRYDDIWLSQLIAISERANLLKYGKNYTIIFRNLLIKDWNVRKLYDEFITSEGSEEALNNLVEYIIKKHSEIFPSELCSPSTEKDEYLADVIQFLGAVEA